MATSPEQANNLADSASEDEGDFEDCLEEITSSEDMNSSGSNVADSRSARKPQEETKKEDEDPLARCTPPSHNSVMIWSLEEALQHQVEQIGVSACGATAVINVLSALGIPCNPEVVDQAIDTHLREEDAPLPQYLFSRSVAGTVHQDLIKGMSAVTDGRVVGRFFDFHPDREVNLVQWLGHWIEKGAVPIATMNMQQGIPPDEPIPDAWHHQMIFGIGPEGVHMVNPLITEKLELFQHHICSESVLLIRQADVVTRCSGADLNLLERGGDSRWSTRWQDMRVAEQCMEMMMETLLAYKGDIQPAQMTRTHVRIPAAYRSGITLFMKRDTPEYLEMLESPGLALKQMQIRA
ncbi:uncharacterized protein [Branchiostoma lanceolatum]|uniref:uncharacterized protein n=1 Tax=Branchiostoma lanceolatum TaxID=7740 RepID=UPI0034528038